MTDADPEGYTYEIFAKTPYDGRDLRCFGGLLMDRGDAFLAEQILDRAVTAHRNEIRLRPEKAAAHGYLGSALVLKGKLDEAVAECREAIRLRPDLAGVHSELGKALESQGKLDEAVAEHHRSYAIDGFGIS